MESSLDGGTRAPGSKRSFDPRRERAVTHEAGLLVDGLAALHHQEVRDASHTETIRQLRVIIGVHLEDQRTSREFFGNLLDRRGSHATRATPGCPKVHENGYLGCLSNGV